MSAAIEEGLPRHNKTRLNRRAHDGMTRPTKGHSPAVDQFAPFPIDALPDPIDRFVAEGAAAIGCDPSYLALPTLAALASAVGSTRRLRLKRGWDAPPILWTAIVGESGTQKSPPWRLAMKPLQRRQAAALEKHCDDEREYEDRLALYEKKMAEWKRATKTTDDPPERPTPPEARRLVVSDTTVEALAPILRANPRGILMSRDELSGWLGSFDKYSGGKAGADESHWLSAYNGEPIIVDRRTGTPRTIYVSHALISIAGGIPPGVLARSLGREHRESGLAARFLFACPPRSIKRWTEAEIDPATEADYADALGRLLSLEGTVDDDDNPRPVILRFFPDAKDIWVEFYGRHAEEQAALEGDLAAAWSKLEEIPARLAIIIHCVRGDGDYLDAETMRAAVRLTEWFKREAQRLYGLLNERPEDRGRRTLLEWIGDQGGEVTVKQTLDRFRSRFKTGDKVEIALRALADAGFGEIVIRPAGPKGGRPSTIFRMNAE